MEEFKRGYLFMCYGVILFKFMCLKTDEEIESMVRVLYVSVIGSIMYGMILIRPDVVYVLSVTSRYQVNSG